LPQALLATADEIILATADEIIEGSGVGSGSIKGAEDGGIKIR
jgi:hypothetical protein